MLKALIDGSPVVVFHEFKKPPYGGGNQFLLALKAQWQRMGVEVGVNRIGKASRVVLFNSYNFDFERLRKVDRARVRMIHRVDGPIGVYRGSDDGTDRVIWQLNHDLADATIFQSDYSLRKHRELGLEFKSPVVIPNAVNPAIFYPPPARRTLTPRPGLPGSPSSHDRIRIIATSWSDNPRKGGAVYQWLDEHLDHGRFEFTFVGRINAKLNSARMIDAVSSEKLAEILREQDIYLTASEHDPCSNALIEALSCGLPAVYRDSGGHPELVQGAGLPFTTNDQLIPAIEAVARDLDAFRSRIRVASIADVAKRYLDVLKNIT